jgi:hypothetical protein
MVFGAVGPTLEMGAVLDIAILTMMAPITVQVCDGRYGENVMKKRPPFA